MAEKTPTRPIRCTACAKPMDSPVCCTRCGTLGPIEPDAYDHFALFGLEPAYEIDVEALRRKYLSLARTIHPDTVGQPNDELRRRSLSLSSELNRAYDTLRDPVSRAEYLLNRQSGSAADQRDVAPQLLGEVMALREQIEDAREANDLDQLESLRSQIADRRQAAAAVVDRLSQSLNAPGAAKELRGQLNAIKYWNNLLDQLPPGSQEVAS